VPLVPLAALVVLLGALATFVWLARPASAVNRWFAAFTIFVASWVLGVTGLQSGAHLDAWARVTFAGAALILSLFYASVSYPKQLAFHGDASGHFRISRLDRFPHALNTADGV